MQKTLPALALCFGLLCGAAQAAPIRIGDPLVFSPSPPKVQSTGFKESFDLSAFNFDDIEHFVLTLTYQGTNDDPAGWDVWLGALGNSQHLTSTAGSVTLDYVFSATDILSNVSNGKLDFGFVYGEPNIGNNKYKFELTNVTLSAYGESAGAGPSSVPEPGTLALLGIGLLGAVGLRRKR